MTTILEDVRVPVWALGYLVNGDESGLDQEDKKAVDDWVEKIRDGGCIDVCPSDAESYFTWHPAFGLACDVEDCNIIITKGGHDG